MTDSEIVDLFLNRDENAVMCMQKKYGTDLKKLAFHVFSDYQIAEECENDTYLALWNSIPPVIPRDYLFAYAARIIRNKALDRLRSEKVDKRSAEMVSLSDELLSVLPDNDPEKTDITSKIVFGEFLDAFLSELSEENRIIFLRRYWFFDSVEEIATRLKISQSKVKSSLFRSRNKMKEEIRNCGL